MSSDGVASPRRDPAVDAHLPEARAVINRVARSFSLAARLLPSRTRDDINLLYLALRGLDDLIDIEVRAGGISSESAEARIAAIEAWCRSGDQGAAGGGRELQIFADLSRRYATFPRDAVADFLAGMRSDLGVVRLATDADLDRYCYQVAGTVGRMMCAILGVREGAEVAADAAARALGAAMQRTNILRDIDEDLANDRIYLPMEALSRHGLRTDARAGARSLLDDDRRALIREQITAADADYARGRAGLRYLRRGGRSIAVAADLYQEILRQIERDGLGAWRPHRPIVGRWRKARLIVGALLSRAR
jgi:phytoene synthase